MKMSGKPLLLENNLLRLNISKNYARLITFQNKPEGKNVLNNSRIRMETDKRFGAGALCLAGQAVDDLPWEIEAGNDSVVCKYTGQNLSLKKRYYLNRKLPCVEFKVEGSGDPV